MKNILGVGLVLFGLAGRAAGESDKPRNGSGESLVYGAVLGLAAVAMYGKSNSHQRRSDMLAARAAYVLAEKPTPFYLVHYHQDTAGASLEGRRARRLNSLALGVGTVAAALLVRGFLALDYNGDAVGVRKEWRF